MPLPRKLRERLARPARPAPLWAGPAGAGRNGGVTFSLLSRWLTCRARFRVRAVEGLRPADAFSHRLEYGQMWHAAEEALAAGRPVDECLRAAHAYALALARRYPLDKDDVEKWYRVCKAQFPHYVKFWAGHPDVTSRTPLLAEQVFDVPYRLPSGRTVRLRGKWDSVDLAVVDGVRGLWLQENKTKGEVDEEGVRRNLTYDLQTMLYLVALGGYQVQPGQYRLGGGGVPRGAPLAGVRYNVVRRPLSGGKGTIVRKEATQGSKCPKCDGAGRHTPRSGPGKGIEVECIKCLGAGRVGGKPAETADEYYARAASYIEAEPETYFYRWNVPVGPHDLRRFREECLDPILENLAWWYDVEALGLDPRDVAGRHGYPPATWRHPYGATNTIDEHGHGDVDSYLAGGGTAGLEKCETLFRELEDDQ